MKKLEYPNNLPDQDLAERVMKLGLPVPWRFREGRDRFLRSVRDSGCRSEFEEFVRDAEAGMVKIGKVYAYDALTGRPAYDEHPDNGKCPGCGRYSVISDSPSESRCLKCGWDDD